MSRNALILLRAMQTHSEFDLLRVTMVKDALDELIKLGLAENKGTFIRDYSYVTMISLTEAGKEFDTLCDSAESYQR